MPESFSPQPCRREFFAMSGGLCLGCLLSPPALAAQDPQPKASSSTPAASWSSEQTFNFAYRDTLIPILLALGGRLGREKLVEQLKAITDEICSNPEAVQQWFANFPEGLWADALTRERWIDAEGARCQKVTRCLWAETFRKAGAGDIGYAAVCYVDYPLARANKEKLERAKTLMQGHECCQFRWTKGE